MRAQVKITTGFPSAAKTAKRLGVSKRVARDLSLLAERSLATGEFVLSGVGRLVRASRKTQGARNKVAVDAAKTPTRRVVRFHIAKPAKDTISPPKKK
jgi:DNA-binding protein HU-beta